MSINAHIYSGIYSWVNIFPGGSEADYAIARAGGANFGGSSIYGQSGYLTPYGDEISSSYSIHRIFFSFEIPDPPPEALGIESASVSWQNSSHWTTPDFDTVAVAMIGDPTIVVDDPSDFPVIWACFTDTVYGTTHEGWSPSIAINAEGLAAIALGGVFNVGIRTSLDLSASVPPDGTYNGAQKSFYSLPILSINYSYPPPAAEPTVTTLPATDLDWFKRSATFNGASTDGEILKLAQVYFKWGGAGLERDSVKIPAASEFSIYLHNARRDYWIYFQAVGIDSGGNKYYGETLEFMLTQEEGAPAYVTKLIIIGQPLVPMETMTLFAKDAESQLKYGKRTYSLSTQYSLSQDDTQVILNTILANNKDPRVNNLVVAFQNLKPGAFKDSVVAADISTKITLINTALGIDGEFWVNNIKHNITQAGLSYAVEWRLERVYETTPAP